MPERIKTPAEVAALRREYASDRLRRATLEADPIEQFARWFANAREAGVLEPNAMSLATADPTGRPSLRTVLLKYFDAQGFVFFTNLRSRKAREIAGNAQVSLLFPWLDLGRQVVADGTAEPISTAEAARYFLSRPRGSQIGAWVSHQSSVVGSRALLESKFEEIKRRFATGEVPLPDFWGGYRVRPMRFEFWQGQPNRLHDRFEYSAGADGAWTIERLAP
jgi:pyridoxamine 5'-phosphate oxidase